MKPFVFALCLLGTVGLAGCAGHTGEWTPMSDGRTAGDAVVMQDTMDRAPADRTFNSSLRK